MNECVNEGLNDGVAVIPFLYTLLLKAVWSGFTWLGSSALIPSDRLGVCVTSAVALGIWPKFFSH